MFILVFTHFSKNHLSLFQIGCKTCDNYSVSEVYNCQIIQSHQHSTLILHLQFAIFFPGTTTFQTKNVTFIILIFSKLNIIGS